MSTLTDAGYFDGGWEFIFVLHVCLNGGERRGIAGVHDGGKGLQSSFNRWARVNDLQNRDKNLLNCIYIL